MSLSPLVQDLSLSPRASRLGLLASGFSPRASRLGLLASSREALRAFALMPLALLTLGLLCVHPASAQSGGSGGGSGWVAQPAVVNGVAYPAVVTGTISGTVTDAYGNVTPIKGDYHNDGSSPPPLKVNAGESLTYKVNGTVTYTWKWNVGSNNIGPPSTQSVLETATAGASGGGDVNGTVTVTASDGGIGKENKVDSVSDDGKTQYHSDGWGGAKLVTMDSSSGTLTVTGTVQAECDLSEPKSSGYPGGGYPGGGYPGSGGSGTLSGNAGCYFTAALDARVLTISASVDSTSYKKADPNTPTDANGDPNYIPETHTRASDGTMYGDTVYSYQRLVSRDTTGGGDPVITLTDLPFINWVDFTPAFIGDWHWKFGYSHTGDVVRAPDVIFPDTWSWAPNESEDNWDYGKCSMPMAQKYGLSDGQPDGVDAATIYNVTYTATDNTDHITASAKYVMAVHDPLENNYPDHMSRHIEEVHKVGPYVRSTPGTGPLSVYAEQGDSWTAGISISGPEAGWFAETLGLSLQFSYTWSYNEGVQIPVNDVPVGWGTYMEAFKVFKRHVGKVDSWTTGGYAGTIPYTIEVADGFGYQAHTPPVDMGGGNPP